MRPSHHKNSRRPEPHAQHKAKSAPRESQHVIFGTNPIIECLRANKRRIHKILVRENLSDTAHQLIKKHASYSIAVQKVAPHELDQRTQGAVHQGFVAEVQHFEYCDDLDLCDDAPCSLIIALDGVTDPHNFGAIARSVHAFGASGIVMAKDRSADVTGTVCKSSAGAIEHLRVAKVVNLVRSLEDFKKRGYWIYGTSLSEKSESLLKIKPASKSVIVLGSEGEGLRHLVSQTCDLHVTIPLSHDFDSLNVAQASTLMTYEFSRQLGLIQP